MQISGIWVFPAAPARALVSLPLSASFKFLKMRVNYDEKWRTDESHRVLVWLWDILVVKIWVQGVLATGRPFFPAPSPPRQLCSPALAPWLEIG